MDLDENETPETVPTPIITPKKQRMKSKPSIIDNLPSYDISEDILSHKSNATLGQILQYPNQRRNLVKILRHPKESQTVNYVHSNSNRKTTTAKCYIRIKGNP